MTMKHIFITVVSEERGREEGMEGDSRNDKGGRGESRRRADKNGVFSEKLSIRFRSPEAVSCHLKRFLRNSPDSAVQTVFGEELQLFTARCFSRPPT